MSSVRSYLADIGRHGGTKSRRMLDPQVAREMVRVREARKLFRTYYNTCFWWARPDLVIRAGDVPWVADGLREHGGREAWRSAAKLERAISPRVG